MQLPRIPQSILDAVFNYIEGSAASASSVQNNCYGLAETPEHRPTAKQAYRFFKALSVKSNEQEHPVPRPSTDFGPKRSALQS